METLNTISLEKAIEYVPAIGATESDPTVSDRYQFVSTREVLERVQEYGWRITNATSQGSSPYAQHRITLIHENDFNVDHQSEGIPRIEMFNSHNRTKRLMFAIGYFRFACSNGLIVATGPAETIRTKHRFSDDRLSVIMEQVSQISARFPQINEKINHLKTRTLTPEEQIDFANFAVRGRFLYRSEIPKRFRDQDRIHEKLLASRRTADDGNAVWQVYNKVQENLIKGIEGFSRPINGYTDSIRVNQMLWKGAETCLSFEKDKLRTALSDLLIKDGKKGKISA